MNFDIRHYSYDELSELESIIKHRKEQLYPEYADNLNKNYRLERQGREIKKKEFEKNILPKIKEYLLANLISNKSIIKVKGARDGKGIRLFLGFFNNNEYLECRQILRRRIWSHNKEEIYNKEEMGQITEHMIDKVTHLEINGKFEPVKQLILD